MTCRLLCRSPPPPPILPTPFPFSSFSTGKPPPTTLPEPDPKTPPPGTPIETRTPLRKLPLVKTTLQFLPDLLRYSFSERLKLINEFSETPSFSWITQHFPQKGLIKQEVQRAPSASRGGASLNSFVSFQCSGFQNSNKGHNLPRSTNYHSLFSQSRLANPKPLLAMLSILCTAQLVSVLALDSHWLHTMELHLFSISYQQALAPNKWGPCEMKNKRHLDRESGSEVVISVSSHFFLETSLVCQSWGFLSFVNPSIEPNTSWWSSSGTPFHTSRGHPRSKLLCMHPMCAKAHDYHTLCQDMTRVNSWSLPASKSFMKVCDHWCPVHQGGTFKHLVFV